MLYTDTKFNRNTKYIHKTICLIFLAYFLSACSMQTQIENLVSNKNFHAIWFDGRISVSIKTIIPNKENHPKIDVSRSFAISQDGTHYNLRKSRNSYVDSQPNPQFWTSDLLALISNNSTDEVVPWTPGNWKLHLVYVYEQTESIVDAAFLINKYFYMMIIHGMPV